MALLWLLITLVGITTMSFGMTEVRFVLLGGLIVGLAFGILIGYAMRVRLEMKTLPRLIL